MFFILHQDKAIYQYFFNQVQPSIKQIFFAHSSLDSIDYNLTKQRDYYIGQIKNEQLLVFAYVNPNLIRFVLAFGPNYKKQVDKKMQSQVRQFFMKVNQQLAITMLNPLYKVKQIINSKIFDQKVNNHVKQYLKMFSIQKKK